MPLPACGPLSLNQIQTEFGGSNPISLSEYYAGGGLVPAGTSGTYGAVPSSGTISIRNFYGTSAIVQGQVAYTTPGAYTWVAPAGVTSVSAMVVAGGAGGTYFNGGGGGALVYINNAPVTPGASYNLRAGNGGVGTTCPCAGGPDPRSVFSNMVLSGSAFIIASCVTGVSGGNGSFNIGGATSAQSWVGGNGGYYGGGGGGAAGYTGQGALQGAGASNDACFCLPATTGPNGYPSTVGGGGGGGAGGASGSLCYCPCCGIYFDTRRWAPGGGGGGVGLLGGGSTTASGGLGGIFNVRVAAGGAGGSGGAAGGSAATASVTTANPGGGAGGLYGAGGGSGGIGPGFSPLNKWGGPGANGAVRIIWPGTTRQFPNTNTGNL